MSQHLSQPSPNLRISASLESRRDLSVHCKNASDRFRAFEAVLAYALLFVATHENIWFCIQELDTPQARHQSTHMNIDVLPTFELFVETAEHLDRARLPNRAVHIPR